MEKLSWSFFWIFFTESSSTTLHSFVTIALAFAGDDSDVPATEALSLLSTVDSGFGPLIYNFPKTDFELFCTRCKEVWNKGQLQQLAETLVMKYIGIYISSM